MSEIAHITAAIFKRAGKAKRFIVAIAGPPGAGKSTLSGRLHDLLPEGASEVVPMDGFHFDDIVLNRRGLRWRKGAPETFDFGGFETLLKRIRSGEPDIAIPVFDRSMELSRAAAEIIGADTKFILVEGNY
ncbi:MAG: nucleoside/nucleotide kinase family protein, partial [Mesorhizobium sp.]